MKQFISRKSIKTIGAYLLIMCSLDGAVEASDHLFRSFFVACQRSQVCYSTSLYGALITQCDGRETIQGIVTPTWYSEWSLAGASGVSYRVSGNLSVTAYGGSPTVNRKIPFSGVIDVNTYYRSISLASGWGDQLTFSRSVSGVFNSMTIAGRSNQGPQGLSCYVYDYSAGYL